MVPPPPRPTGRGEAAAGPSSSLLCHPHVGTRTLNPPPPNPPSLISPSHPSPVDAVAKEEKGECMEKLFREMQEKYSSRGARQRRMEWNGVELNLVVGKLQMGWDTMYLWWAGLGAEFDHRLCALFPSLFLSFLLKGRIKMSIASTDGRES